MRSILLITLLIVALFPLTSSAQDKPCNDMGFVVLEASTDSTAVAQMVQTFRECDPLSPFFEMDGHIKMTEYYGGWANIFWAMSSKARGPKIAESFDKLPVLARRAIFKAALPLVCDWAMEYAHPDELHRYLLDLDWDTNIAPVNPALYWGAGTDWPDDQLEKIEIAGGQYSKTDYWVAMFWQRRGRYVFEAAKQELSSRLTE